MGFVLHLIVFRHYPTSGIIFLPGVVRIGETVAVPVLIDSTFGIVTPADIDTTGPAST